MLHLSSSLCCFPPKMISDGAVLGCAKLLHHVRLCKPICYSAPGSSVHGILQASILEWVAISLQKLAGRAGNIRYFVYQVLWYLSAYMLTSKACFYPQSFLSSPNIIHASPIVKQTLSQEPGIRSIFTIIPQRETYVVTPLVILTLVKHYVSNIVITTL